MDQSRRQHPVIFIIVHRPPNPRGLLIETPSVSLLSGDTSVSPASSSEPRALLSSQCTIARPRPTFCVASTLCSCYSSLLVLLLACPCRHALHMTPRRTVTILLHSLIAGRKSTSCLCPYQHHECAATSDAPPMPSECSSFAAPP